MTVSTATAKLGATQALFEPVLSLAKHRVTFCGSEDDTLCRMSHDNRAAKVDQNPMSPAADFRN